MINYYYCIFIVLLQVASCKSSHAIDNNDNIHIIISWYLSLLVLADRVSAVSSRQKAFSKLLTLKLLGLSDRDLNLEALRTTISSWAR